MSDKKTQQVGIVTKNDEGRRFVQLGNSKNKDPKYNYIVELRVLDNDGKVIVKKTNPRLTMWDPKVKMDWLLANLTVDLIDFKPKDS